MNINMLLICRQVFPCIIKLCNVREISSFITKPKSVYCQFKLVKSPYA